MKIAAIIIAGGKARRFNGADKALISFKKRTLIEHVIERIAPQVDFLAINRLVPLEDYALPTVPDLDSDYPGPIGGLEAGISWAKTFSDAPDFLLTVPVDTPYLPRDLVTELLPAAKEFGASVACANGQIQPTISLHKLGTIRSEHIDAFKNKPLRDFWNHVDAKQVSFLDEAAFININSSSDIEKYQDSE